MLIKRWKGDRRKNSSFSKFIQAKIFHYEVKFILINRFSLRKALKVYSTKLSKVLKILTCVKLRPEKTF